MITRRRIRAFCCFVHAVPGLLKTELNCTYLLRNYIVYEAFCFRLTYLSIPTKSFKSPKSESSNNVDSIPTRLKWEYCPGWIDSGSIQRLCSEYRLNFCSTVLTRSRVKLNSESWVGNNPGPQLSRGHYNERTGVTFVPQEYRVYRLHLLDPNLILFRRKSRTMHSMYEVDSEINIR